MTFTLYAFIEFHEAAQYYQNSTLLVRIDPMCVCVCLYHFGRLPIERVV